MFYLITMPRILSFHHVINMEHYGGDIMPFKNIVFQYHISVWASNISSAQWPQGKWLLCWNQTAINCLFNNIHQVSQ